MAIAQAAVAESLRREDAAAFGFADISALK
jgi:hypothetical protein